MRRLKKRAEFLAVARGQRSARRGFVLQTLPHDGAVAEPGCGSTSTGSDVAAEPGCGFTVTKKVGNSVVRNRIRRRLREAIRLDGDRLARPGFDHVLIGRREALGLDFATLRADLAGAFAQARKVLAKAKRSEDAVAAAPRADDETSRPRGETPGRTR